MESDLSKRNPAQCRACDNIRGNRETSTLGVYRCARCGAIFGTCYLGDSYSLVMPFWSNDPVPAAEWRYFDFTTLGSSGLSRRHGWFDPETRLITQVG